MTASPKDYQDALCSLLKAAARLEAALLAQPPTDNETLIELQHVVISSAERLLESRARLVHVTEALRCQEPKGIQ